MKLLSTTRAASALAVAALATRALGEEVHPARAGPSVSEIRDTLQNLLRSVADEGDKFEAFFKSRRDWCDATLDGFETSSQAAQQGLSLLNMDLKEHEASMDEAQGTIQQVQADIVLVQHTLNQTQEMRRVLRQDEALVQSSDSLLTEEHGRLLGELIENKRQTLTSLQGELDVVVPTLSQLQARVVETKHRIADRIESTGTEQTFFTALKGSCDNSSARRNSEAADREAVSKSIQEALNALGQVGDLSEPKANPAASQQDSLEAVSFVQLSAEEEAVSTEDDLLSIFNGRNEPRRGARLRHRASSPEPEAPVVHKDHKLRPKIRQLLTQLKAKERESGDQKDWCNKERSQNELELRLAQASIGELSAEMDAHAEAESQLRDEVSKLNQSIQSISDGAKDTVNSTVKEKELINGKLKNSALAVRILAQATAILVDLQASGALGGAAKEQAVQRAEGALKSAKTAFEAQGQQALRVRGEIIEATGELAKKSAESVRTQQRERINLESALDSHVSLLARLDEGKRLHETEVKEATTYLSNLNDECKTNVNALEDQERKAEMRALDDAQEVLAGKRMVLSDSHPKEKDGLVEHKQTQEDLSPMERAAAEMGISVDSV